MAPVRLDSTHFSPDTAEFLRLLLRRGVRCLIVEGQAVIFHGHSRLTGDVDFFFDGDAGNARSLFAALLEFWEGDIPGVATAEELSEPGLVVQFGVPPNRIDLLNSIEGVSFSEAWSHRLTATLAVKGGDVPLHFIGLEALIRNKEAAARPRDLEDLQFLKRAREE